MVQAHQKMIFVCMPCSYKACGCAKSPGVGGCYASRSGERARDLRKLPFVLNKGMNAYTHFADTEAHEYVYTPTYAYIRMSVYISVYVYA